jgi:quercetin dioxygenase-like cupin family protein
MHRALTKGMLLAVVLTACNSQPQNETEVAHVGEQHPSHKIFQPADIEWQAAPPAFERGAEIAILEGDPSAEGEVYTLRLKMPPDYVIAPHTHPLPERAVVLSGDFYLGHTEEMDQESAELLEPGTYFTIPPGSVHYVLTGGEDETILHITSVGPLELNYVNPEDDPRLR